MLYTIPGSTHIDGIMHVYILNQIQVGGGFSTNVLTPQRWQSSLEFVQLAGREPARKLSEHGQSRRKHHSRSQYKDHEEARGINIGVAQHREALVVMGLLN